MMSFAIGVVILSLISSSFCVYQPDQNIRLILHNWMRVSSDLVAFENWVCNNEDAVRIVSEKLPSPSLGRLLELDVNGLICTYNTHASAVNQAVSSYYSSIVADTSLTRPEYTIWDHFEEFPANRVETLRAFNAAAESSPQEATRWTVRNEEALVDLKQAFLQSRRQLQGLQGFHW